MNRQPKICVAAVLLWIAALLGAADAPLAAERSRPPGYVDGASLIERAGEDALSVEISLHGALLKAITRADPELAKMAGGLESIHAVILDLEQVPSRDDVLGLVDRIQRDLRSSGWERLARMKEGGSLIQVMLLNDEESIQGIVVLVVDEDDDQVIFANVAGKLDLAAIERLGEEMDIPGLKELD
jgi:hypothetical protein